MGEGHENTDNFPLFQLLINTNFQHIPLFRNEDFLRQKYEVEGLSARSIARIIFSSHDAVNRALVDYGIIKQERKSGYPVYGEKWHKGKIIKHSGQQKIIEWIKVCSSRHPPWPFNLAEPQSVLFG